MSSSNNLIPTYSRTHIRDVTHQILTSFPPAVYSEEDMKRQRWYPWFRDYVKPLQLRFDFFDKDHTSLFHYDSFEVGNGTVPEINIINCELNLAVDSTGTYQFEIEDHQQNVDIDNFGLSTLCRISGKKLESKPWVPMIFGPIRYMEPMRPRTGSFHISFQGFGSGLFANETIVDFKRTAKRTLEDTTQPFLLDPSVQAHKLIRDVFEATDIYPLVVDPETPTLKNRGRYTVGNKILDTVREIVPGIHGPLVPASSILNEISRTTGSVWWIDANNEVNFTHINRDHSGIILKDRIDPLDDPNRVSYFFGEWRFGRSNRKEDGFVNRFYSKVELPTETNAQNNSEGGFDYTFNRDLATQIISPGSAQFRDIALIMERIGTGTSDSKITSMHGHIVKDNNNTPTGNTIARFDFPLTNIPVGSPAPVFISDLKVVSGQTIDPLGKYWIYIIDRGNDETSTLKWFKNQDNTSRNASRAISARTNHESTTGWNVNENSFSYTYSVLETKDILVVGEDPFSIEKYGLVEDVVDIPLANDPSTVDKWLQQMLIYTSKPKQTFSVNTVSIPDMFFQPGQIISIEDTLSGLTREKNTIADVQEVSYSFSADDDGLGARFCSISPIGLYDWLQPEELQDDELDIFCDMG
jgi:hypothetical protein